MARSEVVEHGPIGMPRIGRALERVVRASRRPRRGGAPSAPGDPLAIREQPGKAADLRPEGVVVADRLETGFVKQAARGGKIQMGVDQAGHDKFSVQVDDPGLFPDVSLGPIIRLADGRDGPAGDDHGPGIGKPGLSGIDVAVQKDQRPRFGSFRASGRARADQGGGHEDGP